MDARLREGIRLFNAEQYFAAHESLEAFYTTAEDAHRAFIEALIQLAAAFRLFREFDEVNSPVRMARQALIRLENYRPVFLGIKVDRLMGAVESWAAAAEGKNAPRPPKIALQRFVFF